MDNKGTNIKGTRVRTRTRTKEKIDKYFSNKHINVHPDADLLLEYIGKKSDLEYSLYSNIHSGIRRLRPPSRTRLRNFDVNLKLFLNTLSEYAEDDEITIDSIRNGLRKLCPLWPIC